jgi:hypothetical protein
MCDVLIGGNYFLFLEKIDRNEFLGNHHCHVADRRELLLHRPDEQDASRCQGHQKSCIDKRVA